MRVSLASSTSRPQLAVVPARALSELARIISDGDQVVDMILPPDRGQVIFQMQDIQLVSQLIEGTFPDYEQIIPRGHQTRTVLSTDAFLKACKQAEIFAREGTLIARVSITPGGELQPGTVQPSLAYVLGVRLYSLAFKVSSDL